MKRTRSTWWLFLLCYAVIGMALPVGAATPPIGGNATGTPPQTGPGSFTMEQTLSDNAQQMTLSFDGLAFITGSFGADSFFPPGKVADFWGFQSLRDNDPSEMGHNTDFLTNASLNMLTILTTAQKAQLITLAKSQIASINSYGNQRFILMTAFRRLLAGDLPTGTTGLDANAVKAFSAQLYRLDGQISYDRAVVMGDILANLDATQKAYLDTKMVGLGMTSWPIVPEPSDLQGLTQDEKVAVMTYAGDLYSWYAGDLDADVYFCPERQGTYFGSFYMKDAPAVGNPGYSIPTTITADLGLTFVNTLTPTQATLITDLVTSQKPALYEIVDRRLDVSILLRQFRSGQTPDLATVLSLMERYGELDGDIVARYAVAFAQVKQSLTTDQTTQLMKLRSDLLGTLSYPTGAFLFSAPISVPTGLATDFLFSATATPTVTVSAATQTVSENAGTTVVTVTLSAPVTETVTVGYATSDGTAVAPTDYTPVSGTLTFAPSELSKTITVPLVNDTLAEGDETFSVTLLTPPNAMLSTPMSSVVTIAANDGGVSLPTLAVNAATQTVSESVGTALITVTLSTAVTQTVTVKYATKDGTAKAPADYTTISGTLTFAPNQTSKTIAIPIVDDTLAEGAETLTLTLSAPTNATLGTLTSTTITISANDGGSTTGGKYQVFLPQVVR
ncbi:MAG: Calx-beta domain-containing protein [Chloroflexales bacterium]